MEKFQSVVCVLVEIDEGTHQYRLAPFALRPSPFDTGPAHSSHTEENRVVIYGEQY